MFKLISLIPYTFSSLIKKMGRERLLRRGRILFGRNPRKRLKRLHDQAYTEKQLEMASDDGMMGHRNGNKLQAVENEIARIEDA